MIKLFGVGGHAKVVVHAIHSLGQIIGAVYDDDEMTWGKDFCGYKVTGKIVKQLEGKAVAAIGDNRVRYRLNNEMEAVDWFTVIHPTAIIAEDVEIGAGSVIMAGVVIQSGTIIGSHSIINTGACIDHDCQIGHAAHIGPNCSLSGGCSVGEGAFMGVGSTMIPYSKVDSWSIVGAGAVVTKDIPAHCTAVGVPAKVIKFHNSDGSIT